jgi:hypothetical protein
VGHGFIAAHQERRRLRCARHEALEQQAQIGVFRRQCRRPRRARTRLEREPAIEQRREALPVRG